MTARANVSSPVLLATCKNHAATAIARPIALLVHDEPTLKLLLHWLQRTLIPGVMVDIFDGELYKDTLHHALHDLMDIVIACVDVQAFTFCDHDKETARMLSIPCSKPLL